MHPHYAAIATVHGCTPAAPCTTAATAVHAGTTCTAAAAAHKQTIKTLTSKNSVQFSTNT